MVEFPCASVTVKVTVLSPTLEQVNMFGVTVDDTIPQLSEDPLSISAAVIEAVPVTGSNSIVIS